MRRVPSVLVLVGLVNLGLIACGSSSDEATAPPASSTAGSGGGSVGGKAGAGGTTTAGKGGAAAGTGGASAGKGGASAGSGGNAGTAGATGGSAGAGGKAGNAGASGASACKKDADCTAPLPVTTPASCATRKCVQGACVLSAKDGDGDGAATSKCIAGDGSPVLLGGDCDDNDKLTYPGAWDGPSGDGHPDRCDQIDEDCSGTPDDQKLANGTSCTCSPGDVDTKCDRDAGGLPISFPGGAPKGACAYGKRTCLANATWGPCIGAVGPKEEKCNKIDDDCNGLVDDGPAPENVPIDAVYWAYDGDNDLHAKIPGTNGYQPVRSCSYLPPPKAPKGCTDGPFDACSLGTPEQCCPDNGWKLAAAIPADDCNDGNAKVNPAQPQECKGLDNHCDGEINKGCACVPGTIDAQCSELNGSPVTWPKGAPVGSCKYGSRQCESTGKAWSACAGTIAPKLKDDCSVDGNDDDCNGIPNEGCSCFPAGKTQACGSSTGSCSPGLQTCSPAGTWSDCVGGVVPKPSDSCDPGNDDNCNGVANDGCACTNGGACGSASTCNLGTWSGCLPNVSSGVCSGGFAQTPVGTACNVKGLMSGACLNGGAIACPAGSGAETCSPLDPDIGDPTKFHTTIAPSLSLDWNCDGMIQPQYSPSDGYFSTVDMAYQTCDLARATAVATAYCVGDEFSCPYSFGTNFVSCINTLNPYYDPLDNYACLAEGFRFDCTWTPAKGCFATVQPFVMPCR